jgi:hypothetical protein
VCNICLYICIKLPVLSCNAAKSRFETLSKEASPFYDSSIVGSVYDDFVCSLIDNYCSFPLFCILHAQMLNSMKQPWRILCLHVITCFFGSIGYWLCFKGSIVVLFTVLLDIKISTSAYFCVVLLVIIARHTHNLKQSVLWL